MTQTDDAIDSQGAVTETILSAPARPFSGFERMVAWRYLRARRKEAFISVIAGFSFAGIMLGVATLIIVMAVMNGFRTQLIDRILGVNGHMIVQRLISHLMTTRLLLSAFARSRVLVKPFPWLKVRHWLQV